MCCINVPRCTCPSLINMISLLCADCSREAISSSSCMLCAQVRTGTLRRFPVVGSASCSSSVKALEAHLLTICVCRTPCSHAHQLALPVQCCNVNVSRDTKFAETHRRTPVCLGRLWCHVTWPAVAVDGLQLRGGTSMHMPLRARSLVLAALATPRMLPRGPRPSQGGRGRPASSLPTPILIHHQI